MISASSIRSQPHWGAAEAEAGYVMAAYPLFIIHRFLLLIIIVVRPRPVPPVVRPRPVVPVVTPLPVAAILTSSGRVVALFKNRAARSAELRDISPQASHDPVRIGHLRATQPPDVGRAGHLLFPRSPILLRKRGTLKGDAATHRYC